MTGLCIESACAAGYKHGGSYGKDRLERNCIHESPAIVRRHWITPISVASVHSVVITFRAFRAFRAFRGSCLKLAFPQGFKRAGLFDAIAMEGAAP